MVEGEEEEIAVRGGQGESEMVEEEEEIVVGGEIGAVGGEIGAVGGDKGSRGRGSNRCAGCWWSWSDGGY